MKIKRRSATAALLSLVASACAMVAPRSPASGGMYFNAGKRNNLG